MATDKKHDKAHRHLNGRQFNNPVSRPYGGWGTYLPPGFGWGPGSTAQNPYPDITSADGGWGDTGGGEGGGGSI